MKVLTVDIHLNKPTRNVHWTKKIENHKTTTIKNLQYTPILKG